MEIVTIAAIGLIAAVLAIMLRQHRPDIALLVSVCAGVLIFFQLQGRFAATLEAFAQLADRASISSLHLNTIIKVVGVSYITEFASQACGDAGEKAIAAKIELGGRLVILGLAVPIVLAMLEAVVGILP